MSISTHGKLVQRRSVLKTIAAGATLALPGWSLANNSLWMPEDLPLTPQQTEGPFYPEKTIEQQLFNDTDLSRKLGDHEFAAGQKASVEGVVMDRKGKPVPNSVLEIWQACKSGRYNHSLDARNPALLDNNFQFWGRTITGEDGRYSFTTIIPGKYPGRTARHIHFRVDAEGFKRCSTQCYFSEFGEDNMRDGIYRGLDASEQKLVTIEFDKPTSSKKGTERSENRAEKRTETASGTGLTASIEHWVGQFNIVIANK